MNYLYKTGWLVSLFTSLFVLSANAQLPSGFTLPANATPAGISGVEYFFDTDPGPGNGNPLNSGTGADITVPNTNINISSLTTGIHRLYVRTKNTAGKWSLTNMHMLYIIPTGAISNLPSNPTSYNITACEYFFDTDPGPGNATPITGFSAGPDIATNNIAVTISSLTTGIHRLYVRTKNTAGKWSLSNMHMLYIIPAGAISNLPDNALAGTVNAAEFFVDTDPGPGNGTAIPLPTPAPDIALSGMAITIGNLSAGTHRIYFRTRNSNNRWSLVNTASLYITELSLNIPANPAVQGITSLEYFFDTDPGIGNGHIITVPATADLVNYQFTADISNLSDNNNHTFYIRTLTGLSQTNSKTFSLGFVVPVTWLSFNAQLQPDKTALLSWQTAMETNTSYYDIERSGDNGNFTKIGQVKSVGNSSQVSHYTFTDKQPLEADNYYRLRPVDADGRFSYSAVVHIYSGFRSGFYVVTNPVKDKLVVHYAESPVSGSVLNIVDMSGRVLKRITSSATGLVQQIDVSTLIPGMYIVQYNTGSKAESRKFVKIQ